MKHSLLYLLLFISFNLSGQTITLNCGVPYSGDTSGSSNTYNISSYPCYSSANNFNAGDDRFRIDKSVSGDLVITLFSNSVDHDIFLLSSIGEITECYNASSYSVRSVPGSGLNSELIIIPNAPLGTYYVIVDGALTSDEGAYVLTATCGELNCAGQNINCGQTKTGHSNVGYPNNVSRYCGTSSPGPGTGCTGSERVYQFTLTETSDVSIDLHPYSSNDDFEIFLLSGCDDGACIDFSTNGTGQNETIAVSLDPGTYYIVVDGWRQTSGQYDLSLSSCETAPCDNTIPISCGELYSGNTSFSNNDYGGDDYPCYTGSSPFNAGDEIFHISKEVSGDLVVTLFSNVDHDIFLFDECSNEIPTKSLSCYDENSLSTAPVNNGLNYEVILARNAPIGDYYIIVDGFNNQQEGPFELVVTCGQLNCSSQETITCGETKTGHNNVNYPNNISHYCNESNPRAGGGLTGPERVYQFTLTSTENVSINLHPYSSNDDFDLYLLSSCNDEACIEGTAQGAGIDENIERTLSAGTYYIVVEGWRQSEGFYDLHLECCTRPTLPSCLSGVVPPCEDECACTESNPNLPQPFQCEGFDNYVSNFVTPQSNFWSLETGQADAAVGTISPANKALHFVPVDGIHPGVLYNFFNGDNDNIQCGRYRISWDMKVETGKSAGCRVLYDKNEAVTTNNMAIQLFFSGGNGNITIYDDDENESVNIPFNYPQGTWIKPMFIIELDENQIEFWLNEKLIHLAPYDTALSGAFGGTVLGAITFFGNENSDFLIDNICGRAAQESGCPAGGEKVCIQNGESYDNACQAAQAGLYTGNELEVCITICDYGGEFIGRNDGELYKSGLLNYELAPNTLYNDPDFIATYNDFIGDELTFPIYTDLYIFENEENGVIDINFDSDGTPAFVLVYQCVCDETGCSPVFIGERSDVDDGPLPAGFYYIIVVNNGLVEDYGISVNPPSDCSINSADILSCGDSVNGDFSNVDEENDFHHNGAISNCYNGNRAYAGAAKIYRIEVEQASVVDIQFNAASGAAGVFLFASACGGTCLGYAETSVFGGLATIDNAHLASGFNYLAVFEETSVSSFEISISCVEDDDNSSLSIVFDENFCPVNTSNYHTVGFDFGAVNSADLAPNDIFFIVIRPPGANQTYIPTNLSVTYIPGGENEIFDPLVQYVDSGSGERCAFLPGDVIEVFLSSGETVGRPCTAIFRSSDNDPLITATDTFTIGAQSEIIDYVVESNGILLDIYPNIYYSFSSEASSQRVDITVNNQQEWSANTEQSWIHINPTGSFTGSQLFFIEVDAYEGFEKRTGEIIIQTLSFPIVNKVITVSQNAPCRTPVISFPTAPNQVVELCESESITLFPETGFDNNIYNFYWQEEEIPSGNSRTFGPFTVGTYQIPLFVAQKSCPSATETAQVTIVVSAAPSTPQLNTTTISSCDGQDAFMITQAEENVTYTWNNSNGTEVAQGLAFTPDETGNYTILASSTQNDACFSAVVNLSYTLIETLIGANNTVNNEVCLGDEIILSVSANLPLEGLDFNWSNGITQNAATVNYLPTQVGSQNLSVTIQNGDCIAEPVNIPIIVFESPDAPDLNTTDIVSCGGLDGFTITEPNEDFSYIWRDGNGSTVGENVSFLPQETDFFTVQAVNSQNTNCSSSVVGLSYTLIETLSAENATTVNEVCLGDVINLSVTTNINAENLTFNWSNGITQNTATIAYQPLQAGNQTISVEILHDGCPSLTIPISIQVNELPPSPEVEPVAYCEDDTAIALSVSNITNQIANWYLSENANNSIATGPDYTPSNSGVFWVELEANNCISERVAVQNTIVESVSINLETESNQICLGDASNIIATTTGSPNNFSWSNNINGFGNQVTFFANNEGEHTINLTASNGLCTSSASIDIDVGATNIPIPTIDNTDITICEGDNLPILNVEIDSPESFAVYWYNAPSGGNLLLSNSLSYAPTSLGTYYAETVDVAVNACTSNTRLPITITDVEVISLNISASEVISCEGTPIVLEANAQGGSAPGNLRYLWSDGISQSPTFSFESVIGLQNYTVIVTDADSPCQETASINIEGIVNPTYTNLTQAICIDEEHYALQITTDAAIVTSSLGDDVINSLGSDVYEFIIPTDVGFDILLSNEVGGIICEHPVITVLAQVCECLSANIPQVIAINETVDICRGNMIATLEVQALNDENLIVEWYNNPQLAGAPLTTGFIYETFDEGIYYVIVIDPTTDCTSSSATQITLIINDSPIADAGDDESACFGEMIQLNAAIGSSGLAPLTYDWSPNTYLNEDNIATPILEANQENIVLTLRVTDANDCTSFDQLMIQTASLPEVSINELQSIACYGEQTGQLEVNYSGESPQESILWSTGAVTNIIDQLGAATYSVTAVDENDCENNTSYELDQAAPFTLLDSINEAIIITDGMISDLGSLAIVISGAAPPYEYEWFNENGDSLSLDSIYHTDISGEYDVIVTDENGCTISYSFELEIIVGLSEISDIGSLKLFPNPTNQNVNLEVNLFKTSDVDLVLYDGLGQELQSMFFSNILESQFDINLENLPAGVYWLKIKIDGIILNKKIIKTD